ncbi:MAG: hypothetical protein [Microvirus sp.]|nr:MAG: hypothetical protein [Microvirus sp.]
MINFRYKYQLLTPPRPWGTGGSLVHYLYLVSNAPMTPIAVSKYPTHPPGGLTIMKRSKMGHHASSKLFTRTAKRSHPKNSTAAPMRGGIRL